MQSGGLDKWTRDPRVLVLCLFRTGPDIPGADGVTRVVMHHCTGPVQAVGGERVVMHRPGAGSG